MLYVIRYVRIGLLYIYVYMYMFLLRRREHLHARALQIRAELSTHIHMEPGPHDPHTVFGVFPLARARAEQRQRAVRQSVYVKQSQS